MKFNEFKDKIESIYNGKFDKSSCKCRIYNCLGKSITIDCALAENLDECENHIAGNDMMAVSFIAYMPDGWTDDDDLPENMVMKSLNNSIKVKPENPMFYCDRKKPVYRKTGGGAEKLISAFEKYTERLYDLVRGEYESGNLLPFDMALIQSKGYFD